MKPIEEILSDKRHIYSDNVEISDDAFKPIEAKARDHVCNLFKGI